jgi:hypothetical protein
MIDIASYSDLSTLTCDYNVYYSANGNMTFRYADSNKTEQYITFEQWKALGFDTHSVIINPNLDPNTLIPAVALNYAENLGNNNIGIDPSNTWDRTSTITKPQGSIWENGAFIV